MFTRTDYLTSRCTHQEYYHQFVSRSIYDAVMRVIGREALLKSTDPHFNDIPLDRWDRLAAPYAGYVDSKMRECGDYSTMAGLVCVFKRAAEMVCKEERP